MLKQGRILLVLLLCAQQKLVLAQQQNEQYRQIDSLFHALSINVPFAVGFIDSNLHSTTHFFNGQTSVKLPDEKSLFNLSASAELFVHLLLAYQVSTAVVNDKTYVEQLLPPGTHVNPDLTEMVTLFHLATHTSGFSSQFGNPFISYLPKEKEQPQVLQQLKRQKVIGYNKFKPSFFNTQLLLELIERVESAPFPNLLTKHITTSLGMANTYSAVPEWYTDTVFGYTGSDQLEVYSTLKDILLLVEAQLRPPRGRIGRAMELSKRIVSKEEQFDLAVAWKKYHSNNETIFYHEGETCLIMFNVTNRTGFVVLAGEINPELLASLKTYYTTLY